VAIDEVIHAPTWIDYSLLADYDRAYTQAVTDHLGPWWAPARRRLRRRKYRHLYRIRCRCSHHLRRKPAQVRSITHIAFSLNSGEVRAAVALQGFTTTGSVCDPASDTFTRNLYVIDSPPQFFTDQFPTPIQWRAPTGQKACLVASGVPGAVGRLEVSGYLVG
jgi:hypothetical protein